MKFLIHGYLGFKNLGDELILSKVIEDIRSAVRDAEITVVTIDKDYTRRIHNVEGVVDRISPDAVWEAVKESDVVVVGGGGLIQEYNDIAITDFFKSFGYGIVSYALVPFLAKILRKPVFYWSHGVGPIFTEEGKEFTRWFYSLADLTTLRDASSLSVLKRIYPEAANVHLDADPVLALDLRRFIRQPPISLPPGKKKIGLNLRPWFGTEDILEKVTSAIQEFYRERKDFIVIPIPFDVSLDKVPLQKALTLLPEDAGLNFDFNALETPEDVISLMNELDFFVGMRLHALIVSRALHIPSLSISYDVKTDDFSKKMHMESIRVEDLTRQTLLSHLRQLTGVDKGNIPSLPVVYQTAEFFRDFLQKRSIIMAKEKAEREIADSAKTETVVLSNFIKSLRAEMREQTRIHNTAVAQKDQQLSDLQTKKNALSDRLDQVILEKDSLITQKNQEISNLLSEQEALVNRLRQEAAAEKDKLLRQLNGIYASDFWKAASLYYRTRNNSRLLKHAFRAVQIFRREGFKGLLSRNPRKDASDSQA